MDALLPNHGFSGFGPTAYAVEGLAPAIFEVAAPRISGLRVRVRQECPRRPGVYGMRDVHGELIYVGKAICLRTRLLSYFRSRSRPPKAGRILRPTRSIVWETQPDEFAALLRELEVIRRWRPQFNVKGQPRRTRRVFVCVGRSPAPYVYLSSRPPLSSLVCFGPVPAGARTAEAVRWVNDLFQLRDCPQPQEMVFAEDNKLFPMVRTAGCIRHEIGTCLGPCAAACSQADYADRTRAAQAFLAGSDLAPLDSLEREMTQAATAMQFERAAALRDRLHCLRWLTVHLERLRQAYTSSAFVYLPRGPAGRSLWYLIRGGRVVAVLPTPHDAAAAQSVARTLELVYRRNQGGLELPGTEEMHAVFLIAAWFRRQPKERCHVLQPSEALAICEKVRNLG